MVMKMVMAVVQDSDVGRLVEILSQKKFGITRLASTGGFLKRGNTTLMIGVEEQRIEELLDIIERMCRPRKQIVTPLPAGPADAMCHIPLKYRWEGLRFL